MGSTRLPGKVLLPIGRLPLLGHVVRRLELLKTPVEIIVATSTAPRDDPIATWCDHGGVSYFRGSEDDVLDRYYSCAKRFGIDPILRLTADNPFTDIGELDALIGLHRGQGNDYSHSFGELPIGVGAETFTFAALERSHREGKAPHHREHVNEYMLEHPELFKTGVLHVSGAKKRPDLRLTVDTEDDYRLACRLVAQAAGKWITTEEAIALCSQSA